MEDCMPACAHFLRLTHLSRTTSEGDNLGLPTNFKYPILPIKILRGRSRGFEGGYRTGIEGHGGVCWDSSPALESFPAGVQSEEKEERLGMRGKAGGVCALWGAGRHRRRSWRTRGSERKQPPPREREGQEGLAGAWRSCVVVPIVICEFGRLRQGDLYASGGAVVKLS